MFIWKWHLQKTKNVEKNTLYKYNVIYLLKSTCGITHNRIITKVHTKITMWYKKLPPVNKTKKNDTKRKYDVSTCKSLANTNKKRQQIEQSKNKITKKKKINTKQNIGPTKKSKNRSLIQCICLHFFSSYVQLFWLLVFCTMLTFLKKHFV